MDALSALDGVMEGVARLQVTIEKARGKYASSPQVQPAARLIATAYFGTVRESLVACVSRATLIDEIDHCVHTLLQLAVEKREKAAYIGQLRELRPYLLVAMVELMKAQGASTLVLSPTEKAILETLRKVLPDAGLSYEQVLRDLAQGNRVSWRGTGAELREILREVIDHFAPDDQVSTSVGFQLEKDCKGPTQRQKVRFILKIRQSPSAAVDVLHGAIEAVAALARSTYNRGSVSTHSNASASEIRKLKRYAEAILAELLELA